MSFLRTRLLRRFGPLGRISDVVIVGGAALKFAQRKGLVSDETARRLGASDSPGGSGLSLGEMALVAAAAWRLIRHFSRQDDRVVLEV